MARLEMEIVDRLFLDRVLASVARLCFTGSLGTMLLPNHFERLF